MTREVLARPIYEEGYGLANLIGVIQSVNTIIENPATAVTAKSEGSVITTNLKSLDFKGNALSATSDASGNVTVVVDASALSDIVDGGVF